MSLTQLVEESLARYGEYVALAFEGRQYTNVEQHRTAARVAHALERLGVEPGDRVMVMLPDCPEVLPSYAGILRAGAVIVPVIFLLGEAEVAHILADVAAFVVLKDGETATPDEVMAFCATRLARFKCPKRVRFVAALPKSPIGKILRKELRTQV